jgi:TolB-like protein
LLDGREDIGSSQLVDPLTGLPFQNMSADPEQDYFADGLVEDIIAGTPRSARPRTLKIESTAAKIALADPAVVVARKQRRP